MNKHIFWISSYPKSGNTLVRAILTGLFYSDDGSVKFDDMKKYWPFRNNEKAEFYKINK